MGTAVAVCWNCGHPNVVLEVDRALRAGDYLPLEEIREIASHADDECSECGKVLRGSLVTAGTAARQEPTLQIGAPGFGG